MARRFALFSGLAILILAGFFGFAAWTERTREPPMTQVELVELSRGLFSRDYTARTAALETVGARGDTDMVAALIMALRYMRDANHEIAAALEGLTGEELGTDWKAWMIWHEIHPEIEPFERFDVLKSDMLATIDQDYRTFIYEGVERDIRIEEVVWGGVPARDGIPALNYPTQIEPADADYMNADDLVFGISIDGDTRAYPLRIMNWHEMFNDTVGGVDLALAYCTLCGSGILYETRLEGRDAPIVFGSSGLLYRSNKLMFDPETDSLWNQFTGQPVMGPLTGSGLELKTRPVVITSWENWLGAHPETTVLSLATGHRRDYDPGAVYGDYFGSDKLMFPAALGDPVLMAKDYVFGLTVTGAQKAWALSAFEGGAVINDRVDDLDVVLIGDAATRTVRAFEADGRKFARVAARDDVVVETDTDTMWEVTEEALIGPSGERLRR
ncbi:MAG: DUF3179 domain-containing protein, partial [Alphaproteobacteria bacterium]|nr:DUF3179 domain-containing protein [Alphaproteobacteria bacterium]